MTNSDADYYAFRARGWATKKGQGQGDTMQNKNKAPRELRLCLVDEDEIYWRQKKGDEELEWSHSSTHHLVVVANAMVGPRSWVGALFNRSSNKRNEKFSDYPLSPLQAQRLQRLQERIQVPFDETRPDHQEALRALWHAAFPNIALNGLISEQWKEMGWQGPNPSTDFRGCGFISLENLLFFSRTYPASFHRLLFKQEGTRADWEYPFAVAGINVTFMLIRMLDLSSVNIKMKASFHRLLFKQEGTRADWEYPFAVAGINVTFMLIRMLDLSSVKPRCLPGINFAKLLGEDEEAFDVLYCIAFEMMDAQWLAMHASYMEFNEVLQVTRTQLERELSLEDIYRIQDLPAYNLLYQ
ncbi:elmo domain-containing protein a [Quercus suber]|uniref:Elmo domain-containing protein a n=1 Tax=Quercus suber TaxID=58331 RepID=A0AAW0LTQ2_QUESU